MNKEPGGGFRLILAAVGMGLCCALPLLLVSGGFGATLAWLFDEGVVWLRQRAGGDVQADHDARGVRGLDRSSVHTNDGLR